MSMIINRMLIWCIKAVRPLLGSLNACRYAFSCYDYGIWQLESTTWYKALLAIAKRVLSCNPVWHIFFD